MRFVVFLLLLASCVPSRSSLWRPVDREVEQRTGQRAAWGTSAATEATIDSLLAKPLDRAAATRIALAKNQRLQADYEALGIAAGEIASATVLRPLEVELAYKLGISRDAHDEIEIDVTQDILDLVQLPQRRGIARAGLAAARARAVAATVNLVARVEAAHVDAVAAVQTLELRQTAFDAASASAEIAERMHTAGNLPELSLAREHDRREQTRIELGRAQLDVELAREALNEAMGVSGKATKWTIDERLADVPDQAPALDALEQTAVGASLDLEAAKQDAEAAAGRVGVARVRSWLPELGVGVSASRDDLGWSAGPAVSLGLPIFNQGQGPRAKANAELRRSQNEHAAIAVELRARARATRQRVLETHAESRHLRAVVLPLRQKIVDETLKHYNAMNASPFELLVARRELVDAGRQYIDALRRYWRADADARALAHGAMIGMHAESRVEASSTTTEGH
jgi:cobalt-zinc-cadmium efflux system outer membrane protein